jgi:hypothetical protein
MDRRQLLFGAGALGLVTNLNLNHPLIAQVGTAVMGRTCSDLIEGGIKSINTDYSPDGRLLGQRQGGILDVDMTEFYHGQRKKSAVERVCARPDVTDQFHYDKHGQLTRVRTIPGTHYTLMIGIYEALVNWRRSEWRMLQVADQFDYFIRGTVTTRYNENDQPIESLIRDANGELLAKINQNYKNGRLISETLVIVRLRETPPEFEFTRQVQEQFPEIDNEQARADLRELQSIRTFLLSHPVERSYTYDADDRVIRRLTQIGDFKEEESKTFNEQGDLDWTRTLMIRNGIVDDERSEFRYLFQYDSHGNWTERTKVNADQPGDPNTERRTLAY